MGWIVFGIVAFVVTLWVWRHTYTDREKVYENNENRRYPGCKFHYEYKDEDKVRLPRWMFLIMVVSYSIPFLNAGFFLGFFIYYSHLLYVEDYYFHIKGNKFTKAVHEFFTKDVYAKKKSE